MKLNKQDWQAAIEAGLIEADQAQRLQEFWRQHQAGRPRFDLTHVFYYLGGLVAMGAMSLFMNLGWENFGGWGIFWIALLYAAIGLWLTRHFDQRGLTIPAGIMATFVIVMVPLAIYGLQQAMGWWPETSQAYRDYHRYIRWHWYFLEMGTLAAGVILLWRYRYPFMVMPVAVTLWYLSMDLAPLLAEGAWAPRELRALVSLYFGLLMLVIAVWVDIRSRKTLDYAFWLYLFGVMTFWGGMTLQHADSEWDRLVYFGINLLMILTGVVLARRVFVIFGAIGSYLYLYHLAYKVFLHSWLFPVALTLAGLSIIMLGVWWQRHEARITERLRARLPVPLRELLENRG